MGDGAGAAHKQIQQMINFIKQEAEEKANEIRTKTEHDFDLEKQMLVHNAKLKIKEEHKLKLKENEVKKRISRAAEIGQSRVKKMVARDQLLQEMLQDAKRQIASKASDAGEYKELVRKLTVQALIKIDDSVVEAHCRESDVKILESVLPAAVKDYQAIMKKECGTTVDPKVTVNQSNFLAPAPSGGDNLKSCCGGIVLTALNGRVVCSNTLDARLDLVFEETKPDIRKQLFEQ